MSANRMTLFYYIILNLESFLFFFFSIIIFGGPEALFCIYSSLPPFRGQPTVKQHARWQPHRRTGSLLQAGNIGGSKPRTEGLQLSVTNNELPVLPRATTAPQRATTTPKSHHYFQKPPLLPKATTTSQEPPLLPEVPLLLPKNHHYSPKSHHYSPKSHHYSPEFLEEGPARQSSIT